MIVSWDFLVGIILGVFIGANFGFVILAILTISKSETSDE